MDNEACSYTNCTGKAHGGGICDQHWSGIRKLEKLQVKIDELKSEVGGLEVARRVGCMAVYELLEKLKKYEQGDK